MKKAEIAVELPMLKWVLLSRPGSRVLMVLLSFLGTFFAILAPAVQKTLVDDLTGSPGINLPGFDLLRGLSPLVLIALGFGFFLFSQLLGIVINYIGSREGIILQRAMADALYRKMLVIRPDQQKGATVGEAVSIYATDVPGSTAIVDQAIPMGAGIFFPIVIAPIVIEAICGIEVWRSVMVIVSIVLIDMYLARRQSQFFYRFKQLAAERTGIVNEWIQNIRLLRILGWTEAFEARIVRKREEETVNRLKMVTNGQFMGAFGSTINFVINLTGVAVLIQLKGDNVSPGELFALLWIFGIFLARPFRQIPWLFTFGLDSLTSIRRLENFLTRTSDPVGDLKTVIDHPELLTTGAVKRVEGDLVVRGLDLSIEGRHLLRDINFEVKKGEFVTIVGEVGSGKSLFLLSLLGEVGAEMKKFTVGNNDLLKLPKNLRRKYFTFVPQDGFVMSATLRDNVAFQYHTSPEGDTRVREALRLAQFNPYQERVAQGLDAEIGERGVNLSGGQRQRVSLARAHFFSRPLVLLDDCLSAVDHDTEDRLLKSLLKGGWKNRTRILVTHRLTVLPKSDRVIFLKDGEILVQGRYQDLLRTSPEFLEFVKSLELKDFERSETESGTVNREGASNVAPVY